MKQHRKMLRNGWFSHDGGGGRAVGTPHHEPLWRRTYGTPSSHVYANQPLRNAVGIGSMAGYLTCPYGTNISLDNIVGNP